MVGFRAARRLLKFGALAGIALLGCLPSDEAGGTGTMVLGFGTYSVTVTIPAGEVMGGPIVLDADVTFGAEFFTGDGEPDERVMEPRFRLDVAAVDTTFVRVVPGTAFSGTLQRKAPGTTEVHFSLYDSDITGYAFTAMVPITVN